MRSVSSLYFLLKVLTMLVSLLSRRINGDISRYYSIGTLFFLVTLFVAFAKPYRKPFMNYADTLLLSFVTLLCYTQSLKTTTMFETERILLASPISVIILIHVRKICNVTVCALKFCTSKLRLCFLEKRGNCFRARRVPAKAEPSLGYSVDTYVLSETQPLIAPTCAEVA